MITTLLQEKLERPFEIFLFSPEASFFIENSINTIIDNRITYRYDGNSIYYKDVINGHNISIPSEFLLENYAFPFDEGNFLSLLDETFSEDIYYSVNNNIYKENSGEVVNLLLFLLDSKAVNSVIKGTEDFAVLFINRYYADFGLKHLYSYDRIKDLVKIFEKKCDGWYIPKTIVNLGTHTDLFYNKMFKWNK